MKLKPSLLRSLSFKEWQEKDPAALGMIRLAVRINAAIDTVEDIGSGEIRVWFKRDRVNPSGLTATPWILPATWIAKGDA